MRSPFSAMTLLDNFRGGYGNGGIMRRPLSAKALLDFNRNPGIRTLFLGTDPKRASAILHSPRPMWHQSDKMPESGSLPNELTVF